jgi:hypothetical protein
MTKNNKTKANHTVGKIRVIEYLNRTNLEFWVLKCNISVHPLEIL